ncbi:MAG: hypothetical protein AAGF23_13745, partial [Acidobacteriota bacterium]
PTQSCDPARIPAFLELLSKRRQSRAAHLERAGLRFDRRCLLIAAPDGDSLFTKALGRPTNAETLRDALAQVWGDGVTWKIDPHAAAPPRGRLDARRESPPTPPSMNGRGGNGRPLSDADHRPRPAAMPSEPSRMRAPQPSDSEPTSADIGWDTAPPWAGPSGEDEASVSEEQAAEVSDLPVVRYILSTFGGKIQSVEAASEDSPQ